MENIICIVGGIILGVTIMMCRCNDHPGKSIKNLIDESKFLIRIVKELTDSPTRNEVISAIKSIHDELNKLKKYI